MFLDTGYGIAAYILAATGMVTVLGLNIKSVSHGTAERLTVER
jgi:hypothetical protein